MARSIRAAQDRASFSAFSRETILWHVHFSFVASCLLQTVLVKVTVRKLKGLRRLLGHARQDPARPLTMGQTRLLVQQPQPPETIFRARSHRSHIQKFRCASCEPLPLRQSVLSYRAGRATFFPLSG